MESSYGKSCTSCFRAKYKCIYRSEGDGCERCHRLKRECIPSTSIRKRKLKAPRTKTSELEQKLNRLESLLQLQTNGAQPQRESEQEPQHHHLPPNARLFIDRIIEANISSEDSENAHTNSVSYANTLPLRTPSSRSQVSGSAWYPEDLSLYYLEDGLAEERLKTFRRYFLPNFPFIYINPLTTAAQMRNQKPFLWLVIMSLTSKSSSQQIEMGATIRRIVSQKVVNGEIRSLDTLQGMICYLAWLHFHKTDSPYASMYVQLTLALVYELGIHQNPRVSDNGQFCHKYFGFSASHQLNKERTLEHRRTILSVFLLTSMAWTSHRIQEPFRWSAYMDDCLRILGEQKETELDDLLVILVKCYRIMNQVTHSSSEWFVDETSRAPPMYFIRVMISQLQDIEDSLPPHMQINIPALLYIQNTHIVIREAALKRPIAGSDPTNTRSTHRLEQLEALLTAIERWLNIRMQIPVSEWLGISFSMWGQDTHCVILLLKMNRREEFGWDTKEMRRRVDLLAHLDTLARGMDEVVMVHGLVDAEGRGGQSGIFFRASHMVKAMKAGLSSELGPWARDRDEMAMATVGATSHDGRPDPSREANGIQTENFTTPAGMDDMSMFLADDPWFTEAFMSGWEF